MFGIAVSGIFDSNDTYSYGRQVSPLLLVQCFQSLDSGKLLVLAPLAMILPRSLVPNASMTLRAVVGLVLRRP